MTCINVPQTDCSFTKKPFIFTTYCHLLRSPNAGVSETVIYHLAPTPPLSKASIYKYLHSGF